MDDRPDLADGDGSTQSDVPQSSVPGGALPLRPGARELLDLTSAMAAARRATEPSDIDVVLAAAMRPLRTKLDPDELARGATTSIHRAIGAPAEPKIDAALQSIRVDLTLLDARPPVELPLEAMSTVVDESTAIAGRVGATAVYSHHVVASALTHGLPSRPLDELGVSLRGLTLTLRGAIADRWPHEDADAWNEILGRPAVERGQFSSSVWALMERLGRDTRVTAAALAIELRNAHPEYGGGLFEKIALDIDLGERRMAEEWLTAARDSYDPAEVAESKAERINGRLFLLAVAELDDDLRSALDRGGVLDALGDEVDLVPDANRVTKRDPATASDQRSQVLPGAAADTVPEPGEGRVRRADVLGTFDEVEMIVSVLLARDTPLPLALALFGDWGSGKSFFMALMQERMNELAQLASEGRPEAAPFCRSIRPIRFNAWHYADTDLWASLAATIFDELARDHSADAATEKLTEVGEAQKALATAQANRQQIEQDVDRVQVAVERPATAARASVSVSIRAVRNDPGLHSELSSAAKHSDGAQPPELKPDVERLVDVVGEVHGFGQTVGATWALFKDELLHRRRRVTIVGFVVVAFCLVAIWAVGSLGTTARVLSIVLAVIAALTPAIQGALRVLTLAREARLERELPLVRLRDELVDARRLEFCAEQELKDRIAELGAIRNRGAHLRDFVRERAASADYRGQLGIVSQLRHDFEQLVTLLPGDQARLAEVAGLATEAAGRVPEVERIILYIDDLDRCPHDKVVEVLQAVHLLLAFKLFVVVVGVDSRWLERSLAAHYKTLLAEPDDYLEKIFQISFALRKMSPHEVQRLVDDLARHPPTNPRGSDAPASDVGADTGEDETDEAKVDEVDEVDEKTGSDPMAPADDLHKDSEASTGRADAEDDAPPPPPPPLPRPEALVVTDEERALLGHLASIVSTPRSIKRMMNIYRMLRVSVPDDEHDAFVPGGGDEYQAAVVLLGLLVGRPDLAPTAFLTIMNACDTDDLWTTLTAASHAELGSSGAEDAVSARAGAELTGPAIVAALEPIRKYIAVTRCGPYRRWAPRVSRFSFRLASIVPADDTGDVGRVAPV